MSFQSRAHTVAPDKNRSYAGVVSTCNTLSLSRLLVEKYTAHVVPRSLLQSIVINTSYSTKLTRRFSLFIIISISFFRSINSDVLHDIDRSSGGTALDDGSPNRDTSRGGVLD